MTRPDTNPVRVKVKILEGIIATAYLAGVHTGVHDGNRPDIGDLAREYARRQVRLMQPWFRGIRWRARSR